MSDLDPLPGYGARTMILAACGFSISRPWGRGMGARGEPEYSAAFDLMGSRLAAGN